MEHEDEIITSLMQEFEYIEDAGFTKNVMTRLAEAMNTLLRFDASTPAFCVFAVCASLSMSGLLAWLVLRWQE